MVPLGASADVYAKEILADPILDTFGDQAHLRENILLSDHEEEVEELIAQIDEGQDSSAEDEGEAPIPLPDAVLAVAAELPDVSEVDIDAESDYDTHLTLPIQALELPLIYEGQIYKLDKFDHSNRASRSHRRLIVTPFEASGACEQGHVGCAKRRGLSRVLCSNYGSWESVAFLLAWQRLRVAKEEQHVRRNPTQSQVEDAFHELCAAFP